MVEAPPMTCDGQLRRLALFGFALDGVFGEVLRRRRAAAAADAELDQQPAAQRAERLAGMCWEQMTASTSVS